LKKYFLFIIFFSIDYITPSCYNNYVFCCSLMKNRIHCFKIGDHRMRLIKSFACSLTALFWAAAILCLPAYADARTSPTLILESYALPGAIAAGEDFELHYTIRNTGTSVAENILLSWSSDENAVYPSYGHSNQQYVAQIAAQEAYEGVMTFAAQTLPDSNVYSLVLSMRYQGPNGVSLLSEPAIALQIQERGNLSVLEIALPGDCIVGRQTLISIKYQNTGAEDVRNAKILVEGDVEGGRLELDVGTVKAYATSVTEGYLTILSEGDNVFSISMAFEDMDGNPVVTRVYAAQATAHTVQGETNGSADAPASAGTAPEPGATADLPVILWIAVGVAAAVIVIVSLAALKKRR